jgi:hypothetical protein
VVGCHRTGTLTPSNREYRSGLTFSPALRLNLYGHYARTIHHSTMKENEMNNTLTQFRKTGILATIAFGLLTAAPLCHAGNTEPALTPAAIEQMNLANQLIALGEARKDPLMLIVAAKIQKSLGAESPALAKQGTESKTLLDNARKYAAGRKDLIGLADDVAAEKSKDCTYCTSADKKYFGKY